MCPHLIMMPGSGGLAGGELGWAIKRVREAGSIVGGDICGAFSPQKYDRIGQRFVAKLDHPRLPARTPAQARASNLATVEKLWPLLAD